MNNDIERVKQAIYTKGGYKFRKEFGKDKTKYLLDVTPEVLNNLSKKDLFTLTNSLSNQATTLRKTLVETWETQDIPTPHILRKDAKVDYTKVGLKPTNNMSLQKLRNLYQKQRNFLTSKTSTIEGMNKFLTDMYNRLNESLYKVHNIIGGKPEPVEQLPTELYKKMWSVYENVRKEYEGAGYDSNQIQSMVYEVTKELGSYYEADILEKYLLRKYHPDTLYETKKLKEIEDDNDEEDDLLSIGTK